MSLFGDKLLENVGNIGKTMPTLDTRGIPQVNKEDSWLDSVLYGLKAGTGNLMHTLPDMIAEANRPDRYTPAEWEIESQKPGPWAEYLGMEKGWGATLADMGREIEQANQRVYDRDNDKLNYYSNMIAQSAPSTLALMAPAAALSASGVGTPIAAAALPRLLQAGAWASRAAKAQGMAGLANGIASATPMAANVAAKSLLPGLAMSPFTAVPEAAMEKQNYIDNYIAKAKADGTYIQGQTENDARINADDVFSQNAAFLTGSNALENALTFGKGRLFRNGIANAGARLGGTMGTEAMEEGVQEAIQRNAAGEDWSLSDPEMQDAMITGGVMGALFHGAGRLSDKAMDYYRKNHPTQPTAEEMADVIDTGHGDIDRYVSNAARRFGLSPELIHSVIQQESGYNTDAESTAGAQGIMQLMPGTASMMGVEDSFNAEQNINGGVEYLRQMIDMFDGDVRKGLAAYNAGPGNIEAGYEYADEVLGRKVNGNKQSAGNTGWNPIQAASDFMGKRMDNGDKGCVEAVTKIGAAGGNPFLKDQLEKGVVYVPTLVENAGDMVIPFDASKLQAGDVIVYGDDDHVVLYDGNGGYVGNSSSQMKVVHGDDYNAMGEDLPPTKIIKTGGQGGSAPIQQGATTGRQQQNPVDTYDNEVNSLYEGFIKEQLNASQSKEDKDFFGGFFNKEGNFEATKENIAKIEDRINDDLAEDFDKYVEAQETTGTGKKPQPSQPEQAQINVKTESIGRLRELLTDEKDKAANNGDSDTVFNISKTLATGNEQAIRQLAGKLLPVSQPENVIQNQPSTQQPAQQPNQQYNMQRLWRPDIVRGNGRDQYLAGTLQSSDLNDSYTPEQIQRLGEVAKSFNGRVTDYRGNTVLEFDNENDAKAFSEEMNRQTNNGYQEHSMFQSTPGQVQANSAQNQAQPQTTPVQQQPISQQSTTAQTDAQIIQDAYSTGMAPISADGTERIKQGKGLALIAREAGINLSQPMVDALRNGNERAIRDAQNIIRQEGLTAPLGGIENESTESTKTEGKETVNTNNKNQNAKPEQAEETQVSEAKALKQFKKNAAKVVSDYRKDKISYDDAFNKIANMADKAGRVAPDTTTAEAIKDEAIRAVEELNNILEEKQAQEGDAQNVASEATQNDAQQEAPKDAQKTTSQNGAGESKENARKDTPSGEAKTPQNEPQEARGANEGKQGRTYSEVQKEIDKLEEKLIKQYGEDAVLFGDYPGREDTLPKTDRAKLQALYEERDSAGKHEDDSYVNDVLNRLKNYSPLSKDGVSELLETMVHDSNLSNAFGHRDSKDFQRIVKEIYTTAANWLHHEKYSLPHNQQYPEDFIEFEYALSIANKENSKGYRSPYGISPAPLLKQANDIARAALGMEAENEPINVTERATETNEEKQGEIDEPVKRDFSKMSLDELKAERQKQIDEEVERYKRNPGGKGTNNGLIYSEYDPITGKPTGEVIGRYGESLNPEWYQRAYKMMKGKPRKKDYPYIADQLLRDHQEYDELVREIERREAEERAGQAKDKSAQKEKAANEGGKKSVDEIKQALRELAEKAWADTKAKGRVDFPASSKLRHKVKELFGHEIDTVFVTANDLQHIKKQHTENEESRGQVSITPDLAAEIYDTVNDFDTATLEQPDKLGNKKMMTVRDNNGRSYVLLIERGRKKAEVKTAYKYKKKENPSPMADAKIPEPNVRNDSAKTVSPSVTSSVPQNQPEVTQKNSEPKQEKPADTAKEYKYYMNERGVSPGAQPKGFTRFDEDDKGGRHGAIYYDHPLTEQEIADYELTPAKEPTTDPFGDKDTNIKEMLEGLGITEEDEETIEFTDEFGDTTDEEIEAIKSKIRKKMSRISANALLDPELYVLYLQLGGKYIQKGYRTFKKWLGKMTNDFGEEAEPWAAAVWETLKTYPKGQKFEPKQVMLVTRVVGNLYGEGTTSLEDVQAEMKKLLKGKHKQFAPVVEASYNGVKKFYDTIKEGKNNVTDSTGGLASRTSQRDDQDAVGRNDESGRPGSRNVREGRQETGDAVQQQDSTGIRDSSTTRSGETGNSRVQAEESEDRADSAGSTELSGSVRDSYEGSVALDDGRKAEDIVSAEERREHEGKEVKPENVEYKAGDLDSIRADLPMLLPEQQEDVQFIEKRLLVNEGTGVLLTNGTGTGKTYSGLGMVKRFANSGKKNMLIVVPSEEVAKQWQEAAKKDFGLDVKPLESVKDNGGKGICVTTYANFQQNKELAMRDWDAVIADESHNLMQNKDGEKTGYLSMLRALTKHPREFYERFKLRNRTKTIRKLEDEIDGWKRDIQKFEKGIKDKRLKESEARNRIEKLEAKIKDNERAISDEYFKMNDKWQEMEKELKAIDPKDKPKVLFLSATPFAYDKCVDYAEGYLFDYPEEDQGRYNRYNAPSPREEFMIRNFGYRMRYNKLTRPDSQVDNRVMEVQFHDSLVNAGAMHGRQIDIDADYDRGFILVDGGIGTKIDEGFRWLREQKKYRELEEALSKQFRTRTKKYLLESIKAKAAIPIVREYLKNGKKVVLFHQVMKEKTNVHPFVLKGISGRSEEEIQKIREQWDSFQQERPDLVKMNLNDIPSPMETFRNAFGDDALYVDGSQEHKKGRKNAQTLFNDDNSGKNIIICQQDAANAGISLHDTTGKHPRVLINIAMPERPIYAMQIEGRIYRVGNKSNAVFRYLATGTDMEKEIFANTIGTRAETAENLAQGQDARGLHDSFTNLYMETMDGSWERRKPGHAEEGTGGKEMDFSGKEDVSDWQRAISFYFGQQKKTSRNKAAEGKDYFATPEPIGLKMVQWLGLNDGDSVLEPSAGHGAISRWFSPNTSNTIVEPSGKLAPIAQMVTPEAKVVQGNFEDFNVVNKFDGIAMNPPFGSGGKTAVDHIAKAFRHLKDGGRLIAILPEGPSADAHFDRWFWGTNKEGTPVYDPKKETPAGIDGGVIVGNIHLPQVVFKRAGTSVGTRIVVIDKQNDRRIRDLTENSAGIDIDLRSIDDINELFERMENMTMPERITRKDVREYAKSKVAASREDNDDSDTVSESTMRESYNAEIDDKTITIHSDGKITGKTYDVKETIKRYGGKWLKYEKAWVIKDQAKLTEFINKYNTDGVHLEMPQETEGETPPKLAVAEGNINTRSMDELKAEAKEAFPGAKVQEQGNQLIMTMPNGQKVTVTLQESIEANEAELEQARTSHGFASGTTITIEGYAETVGSEGFVALSQGSRKGTGFHEAYHIAEAMAFTKKELADAKRLISANEEERANEYAKWRNERKRYSNFAKLWQKIADMAAKLAGLLGHETKRNLFRKVESGEIYKRDNGNGRSDVGRQYSASDNSTPSLTQRIRNILSGVPNNDQAKEMYRKSMARMLEDALGVKIRYAKTDFPQGETVIYKEKDKVIRSLHAYDWENILPVAGGLIAERLGISDRASKTTPEMKNYIADWILTGAANNNSPEARQFQKAMANHPAYADKLIGLRTKFQDWMDKTAQEKMQQTVQWTKEKSLSWKERKDLLYEQFVEELAPIEKLVQNFEKATGKKLEDIINPMTAFRLFRGSYGRAITMIEGIGDAAVDGLKMNFPGVDFTGFKTLRTILADIGALQNPEKQKDFGTYCIACHIMDMHKSNKNIILEQKKFERWIQEIKDGKRQGDEATIEEYKKTIQDLKNEIYETPPQFSWENCEMYIRNGKEKYDEAQKSLVRFSNVTAAILANSGLISDKHYNNLLKKWPNYVPLFRVFEENENIDFGDSMKRVAGSTRDIVNPIESIIHNTVDFIKKAEKNRAKCLLADLARCEGSGWLTPEEVDNNKPNTKTTVTFYENGVRKYLETEPAIVEAINNMDRSNSNTLMKFIHAITAMARACFTIASPEFAVRNVFRDYADMTVYNKYGFVSPADWIRGLVHAMNRDSTYYEWLSSGAAMASAVSLDRNYTKEMVDKLNRSMGKRMLHGAKDVLVGIWTATRHTSPLKGTQQSYQGAKTLGSAILEALQKVGEYSEYATRISMYEKTKKANQKAGTQAAIVTAALQSRDLMDFSRHGKAGEMWNKWVPFANASLQGMNKFYRTILDPQLWKEDRKQATWALARLMLSSALPAMVLFLAHHDDDWYKEAPDWLKETHWLFKIGDTVIRIPKGSDVGIRFISNAVEKGMAEAYDNEKVKAEEYFKPLMDAVPDLFPIILKPMTEAMLNKSFFTKRNIVPQYQEKLPEKLQYGPYTTGFSKLLGEKLGIAPSKIDHVIAGYTGSMGMLIPKAIDLALGTQQLDIAPTELPLSRSITYMPYKNPRSVQKFYELLDEQTKYENEYKMTKKRPEELNPALLERLKATKKHMAKLSKEEKDVINNPNLTLEQRKKRQMDIQQKRINLVKQVVK